MRILFGHARDKEGHELLGHGLSGNGDSILALFSGASAGVGFYYPTVTVSNLFQDTSRTTPVTTNGDGVAGVEDASGADNHASQGTPAAVPTWGATNKGIVYDGIDDVLSVSGLTGITTSMTLAGGILSSDTSFDLFGNSQPFIQASSATTTALGYGGSLWIDGVKIYNASEADALALADGNKHTFEVRGCDPSGETTLSIGEAGFAGTLMSPYLTRATNVVELDAARAKLASDHGITLRNTETLVDQVATGGVYGPSNDISNMFQDSGGTTPVTADQDPVGLVSNPVSGGADLTQSTAAARPLYDETSGLYDFDGTDDHFIADLTGIGDRSDMYFACVVNAGDASGIFISSQTSHVYYAGTYESGNASSPDASCGTPSYYVDGVLLSSPTRDDLYTALMDGNSHLFEITNLDLSNAFLDDVMLCSWAMAGYNISGLAGEFVLIPNPGVVGRNIIRRDILARHPSITFAGA